MTYYTNTLPRPNLKLPPQPVRKTEVPLGEIAYANAIHELAIKEGRKGGTPMGSNQLNEDRKAKGEKSGLIITAFLSKNPGVKRGYIARGLGVNQNTLQSQLQRLHSTGIINRSASNEYTNAVTA
jgi:DNA invertase Pin-like site-specific DNA recombinase